MPHDETFQPRVLTHDLHRRGQVREQVAGSVGVRGGHGRLDEQQHVSTVPGREGAVHQAHAFEAGELALQGREHEARQAEGIAPRLLQEPASVRLVSAPAQAGQGVLQGRGLQALLELGVVARLEEERRRLQQQLRRVQRLGVHQPRPHPRHPRRGLQPLRQAPGGTDQALEAVLAPLR